MYVSQYLKIATFVPFCDAAPHLNIRIHKTNFINSLFLLDNHSFKQKSGIQLVKN